MSKSAHPEPSIHDAEPDVVPTQAAARVWLEAKLGPLPVWVALLVVAGLFVLAGSAGFAVSEALHRNDLKLPTGPSSVGSWRAKVARNPRDVVSRLGLASALQSSGQLDSALAEYDTILHDDPRDVAALVGRGDLLFKLNRPEEAEASLWEVLAQDEGHVRAAEILGEYYASNRQFRSLVKAVRPAVTAHPSEARLQYLMGFAYEQLGNVEWAASRYRLALDAVPDMPEPHAGLRRLGR